MPRSSRWTGNDEMWDYAAALIRGGLTYSAVSAQLSNPENRKKFGLKVIPRPDTIRYQLKKRGLLESPPTRSALPQDELKSHHKALAFLGLGLRAQANVEETGRRGPQRNWLQHLRAGHWHGFRAGPLSTPVATEDEEIEIDEDWTNQVLDPRDLAYYGYFLEHLEATASGRTIAESLSALFKSTKGHTASFQALWAVAEQLLDEQAGGKPEASSTERVEYVMRRLHPAGTPVGRSIRPPARQRPQRDAGRAMVEEEMVEALRSRPEYLQLVQNWKRAVRGVENLRRSLKPIALVRRTVQDGECSICRLDDYS